MFMLWVAARCVCNRKTRRWQEVRVLECVNVPVAVSACVGAYKGKWSSLRTQSQVAKYLTTRKVTYQYRTHASKFKAKTDISCASGNTNPRGSPTWKIWPQIGKRASERLPTMASLRRGVDLVTPLCKVDGRWSNASWHWSITTHLLHIDWPHTGDYR